MLDYRELARKFGVTDGTIRNTLLRNEIQLQKHYRKYTFPTTKFEKARSTANKKNIEFLITKEDLQEQWDKQDGICVYSGKQLSFPTSTRTWDGNASLDRIDSNRGYVEGNIQWVHKDVNLMKYDLTEEQFEGFCKAVVSYITHKISLIEVTIPFNLKKVYKRIHGAEEQKLCSDYMALTVKNYNELARKYGVNKGVVKATLLRNGLVASKPRLTFHYKAESFGRLYKNAVKRNLDVTIDMAYLRELFEQQKGACSFTGWALTFPTYYGGSDGTASIDRIDSSEGYVPGNVQWVHKTINLMKLVHKDGDFVSLCSCVVTHRGLLRDTL